MRSPNKITLFALLCFTLFSFYSCQEDTIIDESSYGYLQLRVIKSASVKQNAVADTKDTPQLAVATRSDITELDFLAEAKKIKLYLRDSNGRNIVQSVALNAASDMGAEYGLRSDRLQLLPGKYTIVSYTVIGKLGEELMQSNTDYAIDIEIVQGAVKQVTVDVAVTPRGHLTFVLGKNRDNFPSTKAEVSTEAYFEYSQIRYVKVNMKRNDGITFVSDTLPVAAKTFNGLLEMDTTMTLQAGEWKIVSYTLFASRKELLTHEVVPAERAPYIIKDNDLLSDTLQVKLQYNKAINDYIKLRTIWQKMDGPHWSYQGIYFPKGTNWNFEKPLEEWGNQPDVQLANDGRIESIDFGEFNPSGIVPAEIGDLQGLRRLSLGTHLDQGTEGAGSFAAKYNLKGKSLRIDLSKSAVAARRVVLTPSKIDALFRVKYTKAPRKAPITRADNLGWKTNHIKGIDPAIGKLTKLESLLIANGDVTDLPMELANCINLTDLELYNCVEMTKLPDVLAEMPNLIALNIACNGTPKSKMSAQALYDSLDKLFKGKSNQTLQLLYANKNRLEKVPASIANLKKIGMLELSDNAITDLPVFTANVSPVQLFLGNNKIKSFPVGSDGKFCNTDDLESFNCAGNLLTEFPNIFDAKSDYIASSVDFSKNKISKMPDNFKGVNANIVNLAYNKLTGGMPIEFATTNSKIAYLQFQFNRIDSIPGKAVKGFFYLTTLDMMGNRLKELPFDFNGKELPYMTGLDLSNNQFEKCPMIAFDISTLAIFNMREQRRADGSRCWETWPEGMFNHKGLRVVDFSGNALVQKRAEQFPYILNKLDISDNPDLVIDISEVCQRIQQNTFKLICDEGQTFGCKLPDEEAQ